MEVKLKALTFNIDKGTISKTFNTQLWSEIYRFGGTLETLLVVALSTEKVVIPRKLNYDF